MSYGVKVHDASGNSAALTVKIGQILEAGTVTMSDSLNSGNLYGEEIALGATYDRDEIGVIAYPTKLNFSANCMSQKWSDDSYAFMWYADSTWTYYEKNETTGVMSSWTAGAMTSGTATTFDGVGSCFPLAGWDYLDSETTFNSVTIWAAMAHVVYDSSATALKTVYSIGTKGVEEVQYMVFLRGT